MTTNACTHLYKPSCVHGALRVSAGTCSRCPSYTDSGKLRLVQVRTKHTQPVQAVPRDQWPWAARIVAKMRADVDKGIGDTLQRLFAKLGGEWVKATYHTLTGKSCGCESRQRRANELFPY